MSEASKRSVALVTGAAQGIGLGIARELAAASYRVVLADVARQQVEESAATLTAEGRTAIGEHLDVTCAENWARTIERTRDR